MVPPQSVQLSLFNLPISFFSCVQVYICVFPSSFPSETASPAAPKHQVPHRQCLKCGVWYQFGWCTVNDVLYKVHCNYIQLWKHDVKCVLGILNTPVLCGLLGPLVIFYGSHASFSSVLSSSGVWWQPPQTHVCTQYSHQNQRTKSTTVLILWPRRGCFLLSEQQLRENIWAEQKKKPSVFIVLLR